MGDAIATRVAYGKALVEFGASHPELLVLDADLAGATKTDGFKKAFPERFFDMGIAEGNMMGFAAGLAACGKTVFANSFAIFSSGRAYEQVRNSIAYPGLNVKVVGSHGGLSVGEDGATHQCIEDLTLMRAIPGMTVICPCDGFEMREAVKSLLEHKGPAYLRLARLDTPVVTDAISGYKFEIGRGVTLCDGSDVAIIAVGLMVEQALKAQKLLANDGISARVIDMHTVKPLDTELVLKAARETGCIVTSEEHTVIGGLGAAVSECVCESLPVPVVRHGVQDEFGRSGKAKLVLEQYGLTAEKIAEAAKKAVALKK